MELNHPFWLMAGHTGSRVVLIAVLALAAGAKLADRDGAREATRTLGVPDVLTPAAAKALPWVELAIAAALLGSTSAWIAANGALALFTAFTVILAVNLALGRRPTCHCFGALDQRPIGPASLARNALLMVPALVISVAGPQFTGPSFVAWIGDLSTYERATGVAVLLGLTLLGLVGKLLFELLGQQGRILLRLDELERRIPNSGASEPTVPLSQEPALPGHLIGAPAPDFYLPDMQNRRWDLPALLEPGLPLVLFFLDPSCGPCGELLPEIGAWQRSPGGLVRTAVISRGSIRDNRHKMGEHDIQPVLRQKRYEVATAYECHGTPGAILLRPDGTIGSKMAQGAQQIRALMGQFSVAGRPVDEEPALPDLVGRQLGIGRAAPDFMLPDLNGETVTLGAFRGRKTLLLFWNPSCGFCQQMLPELRIWESAPRDDAPNVLVVSTGSVDDNRALGIRSRVVLDGGLVVGRLFQATGTPMAVLVDAQGRIASEPAAGSAQVWMLVGHEPLSQT